MVPSLGLFPIFVYKKNATIDILEWMYLYQIYCYNLISKCMHFKCTVQ